MLNVAPHCFLTLYIQSLILLCSFIWTLLAVLRSADKFRFGVPIILLSCDQHFGQSDRNKVAVWSVQWAFRETWRTMWFFMSRDRKEKHHRVPVIISLYIHSLVLLSLF